MSDTKTSQNYQATTVVVLTIEVVPSSRWGADCSLEQVRKQAREEALGIIGRVLEGPGPRANNLLRIVGEPEVRMTIVQKV